MVVPQGCGPVGLSASSAVALPWALGDMNPCESESLSQFYPLEEARIFVRTAGPYFVLEERHRHQTGSWGQCRVNRFESLTWAEVADVLDAIGESHHLRLSPSERRSTL